MCVLAPKQLYLYRAFARFRSTCFVFTQKTMILSLTFAIFLVLSTSSDTNALLQFQQQQQNTQFSDATMGGSQDPIARFTAKQVSNTSVHLYWTTNQNKYGVDSFDIEYGPAPHSTNEFLISSIASHIRDYAIGNLQPNTFYEFKLQPKQGNRLYKPKLAVARTDDIQNKNSQMVSETASLIQPHGLKAETKSSTTVQLSWIEHERTPSNNNILKMNTIRYAEISHDSSVSQTRAKRADGQYYIYLNVTNSATKTLVQKLKPATEYRFAVKTLYLTMDMKKLIGQSTFTPDVSARTFEAAPSAPRDFTIHPLPPVLGESGESILELRWLPPENPNGELKGYVILYSHDIEKNVWDTIDINQTKAINWFIKDLRPELKYYFKLRAKNAAGQSVDSQTHLYQTPSLNQMYPSSTQNMFSAPIPASNILLLIGICLSAILFILFCIVSKLACSTSSRKSRKSNNSSVKRGKGKINSNAQKEFHSSSPRLNGFASTNSSSTVAARVSTLARKRTKPTTDDDSKPDFWINSAIEHNESKSNSSDKSNSDMNLAMVSVKRESPQFLTTQVAQAPPDYRFGFAANQVPHHSHYQPSIASANQLGHLNLDQMDNATASALMTLSKRQQQQLQKYQIQFANNNVPIVQNSTTGFHPLQPPSPNQQPPPPPPLNIEYQQQQQQQKKPFYGTYQPLNNTRSLRLNRPTLYDPVSGSFVQGQNEMQQHTLGGPPTYGTHNSHYGQNQMVNSNHLSQMQIHQGSNTLQFNHINNQHPHQTSTLSRRQTNTFRSFNNSTMNNNFSGQNGILTGINNQRDNQTSQHLLQSHQAVINQLSGSAYPSVPLKHVSAVRPQVMFNLDDQIELELKEKERQKSPPQQMILNEQISEQ